MDTSSRVISKPIRRCSRRRSSRLLRSRWQETGNGSSPPDSTTTSRNRSIRKTWDRRLNRFCPKQRVASVLVIDDDANNRLLLATLIRHAGHTAIEAASGREGIAAAEKQKPDAVVVDLSLPDVSGAEVIRRLRSNDATKNAKIALYTATRMNAAIEELVELFGVDEVIPKP